MLTLNFFLFRKTKEIKMQKQKGQGPEATDAGLNHLHRVQKSSPHPETVNCWSS